MNIQMAQVKQINNWLISIKTTFPKYHILHKDIEKI